MPAKKTRVSHRDTRAGTSRPNTSRRHSAGATNVPASASRKGDSSETMWEPVLNRIGFTVEHVFPIGTDPDMHGVNYIVIGMPMDPKLQAMGYGYATWLGIDWTHHPNSSDREAGCVLQCGHYMMTEVEAFADASERVMDYQRRFRWDPVPSGSVKSVSTGTKHRGPTSSGRTPRNGTTKKASRTSRGGC